MHRECKGVQVVVGGVCYLEICVYTASNEVGVQIRPYRDAVNKYGF